MRFAGLYVSGLQPLGSVVGPNLGLRPRLLWGGPSALKVGRLRDWMDVRRMA